MKHIALDKFYSKPKLLMTMLVMLTLSMFAIHSHAAQTDVADSGDKTQARFDHMTTGFPLTGAHAIADCGSCHIGGIFKGTPRNCASCHTKGQRVVAIDMPATHFATTEPCDVCHTNTVTFLGARYDHGKAVPGQCTSCHNGVVSTARAPSHTSGAKATRSCDSCHRTFAWIPASWNHNGVVSTCVTCHTLGGDGVAYVKNNIGGTSPEGFAHNTQNNSIGCESCHHSYTSWIGAMYDHATAGTPCSGCHNGSRATGTAQFSGHTSIGSSDCNACHTSTVSWLGALGAMPAGHIPASKFNPSTISCANCHPTAATWITGSALHANVVSSPCEPCHLSGANITGATQKSHNQPTPCANCHHSFTGWGG